MDKRKFKKLLSWVRSILLSFIFAVFITNFLVVNAQVPTGSMETTIMIGDRIIGNRLAYNFAKPNRGDIIFFLYPDDETQLFVKRVIGLPGETVEIVDGRVYINESETPLDEPYLTVIPDGDYGPFFVPDDSYFVMGDNRNDSYDSRYWNNPYVNIEKIKAKAELSYYPDAHFLN